MSPGILLAIGTALLAAALSALLIGADAVTAWLVFALAVIVIGVAAAWSSDRIRRKLPFQPFRMRCHALWLEGKPLEAVRNIPPTDLVPDDLYEKIVDWDRRVWDLLLDHDREAGNIEENRLGGRLANLPRDTAGGIAPRVAKTRAYLASLVEQGPRT